MTQQQEAISRVASKINNCAYKEILRVKDMELHKHYKIIAARKCTTQYGRKVVLELDSNIIYMPQRFDNLEDDVLDDINKNGPFYIISKGEIGKSFDLAVVHQSELDVNIYNNNPSVSYYNHTF